VREGLARCAELGPSRPQEFDGECHPTVSDLVFCPASAAGEQALARSVGRSVLAVVGWLLPAKKPPGHRANVPVPLPAASGADVGAHAALARMLRARQRAAGACRPRACLYSFDGEGRVRGLPAG